jgi:8-oxo-dGTP diphosphatase
MTTPVIRCVGAVVWDADRRRFLLVKRGHEPDMGRWSLPGGRIEVGEALVREMREETGLTVLPGRLLGAVRRPVPGGGVLDIKDYEAAVTGGVLAAGDDAAEVRWVNAGELSTLPVTAGLVEALTSWGVL